MHAQPYSEAPANLGRGRGRTSGGKRPVAVQIVRDLLHSRSGSGSGCITDQNYFWIANRVYQSWLLRFRVKLASQRHTDNLFGRKASIVVQAIQLPKIVSPLI